MKRTNSFVIASLVFVSLIAIPGVSYAQAPSAVPALPDYSDWQRSNQINAEVYLNGRQTTLRLEGYLHTDFENLMRYSLILTYNEQGNLWLADLWEEIGQRRLDKSIFTIEEHRYIFENIDGNWMFVHELSTGDDTNVEAANFIRERYNLEFR